MSHDARSSTAAEATAGDPPVSAMTGDQAVQRLLDGNARFVAGTLMSLGNLVQERAQAVSGQSPFAVIVSCSDSRVPPELVFDQSLGQLFVIRTAGQVLDEAARSSIAFGVDALQAPLVFVLGHSGCGAVTAALAALTGQTIPGYAWRFAEGIGPAVRSVLDQPGDPLDNAVRANVTRGVARLRATEPALAGAVRAGRLKVAGGYYDGASGEVRMLA